jgi:hydrogenase maturation factor HypE
MRGGGSGSGRGDLAIHKCKAVLNTDTEIKTTTTTDHNGVDSSDSFYLTRNVRGEKDKENIVHSFPFLLFFSRNNWIK